MDERYVTNVREGGGQKEKEGMGEKRDEGREIGDE